jgi:hypothetical protein
MARERELQQARIAFMAAFAKLRNLCNAENLTYSQVEGHSGAHDVAIVQFTPHVGAADLESFKLACDAYRKCREPKKTLSQQLNEFFTPEQRNELAKAIDALLAFAGKP